MNVFEKLIERGKIQSQDELRKYYRIFAIKIHPDMTRSDASNAVFIKLNNDYENAKTCLVEAQIPKTKPTREEIYQSFWDIEASGFPVDISIRDASMLYVARLEEFSKALNRYGALTDYCFSEVERDMYRIRGDDIIDNPLFGKVRMIFYNLVTWHLEPKKFTRLAIERWFTEIESELKAKNYGATYAFLRWLVDDLANGGALTTK